MLSTSTSPSPSINTRIFNPQTYFLGPPDRIKSLEQPSDLIHHISSPNPSSGITHLATNNLKAKRRADRTLTVDRDSIVVSVDGYVKDGHAAFGGYFGKGSGLNIRSLAPENKSQTKEVVLLLGTAACLKVCYEQLFVSPSVSPVEDGQGDRGKKKRVVIITDSNYLVKCMTGWIWTWQSKGLQTTKGELVGNHVEIKALGAVCLEVEGLGVDLKFWLVEEGGVEDARRLAEKVLDEFSEEMEGLEMEGNEKMTGHEG